VWLLGAFEPAGPAGFKHGGVGLTADAAPIRLIIAGFPTGNDSARDIVLSGVTQHDARIDDGRQFSARTDGVRVEYVDFNAVLGQVVLEQVSLNRVRGQVEGLAGYRRPRFSSTAFTGASICVRSPTMTMTALSGRPSDS
jgi:hypothetical protein